MNWSYTVPAEPGRYWWQQSAKETPLGVWLGFDHESGPVVYFDIGWSALLVSPVGRWSPRIEAPKGDEPWEAK